MKEEVRALWDICFGDDEAFTELYFSRRYNEDVNIVITEKDRVISALQILPYTMTYCKDIIPMGYISGACTHPDFRNKGAMKRLLSASFSRMKKQGIPLTTLIPAEEWLFDYYSKTGFVSVFEYSSKAIQSSSLNISEKYSVTEFNPPENDVYAYFNKKMLERPYCIQHSEEDFNVILEDLHLGDGALLVARLNNQVKGIIFCYSQDEVLHVPELFYENKTARDMLLAKAAQRMNVKEIDSTEPPTDEMGEILGMARIIDAERMLILFAKQNPEIKASFNLIDEFIKENNRFYSMKSGKIEKGEAKESFISITIEELTQALMGYNTDELPEILRFPKQHPYMSLMLN
jgi:hypothetical protein